MKNTDDWQRPAYADWPASERRERLEYIADLLRELEALAARDGCRKLPDQLALARAEALREAKTTSKF